MLENEKIFVGNEINPTIIQKLEEAAAILENLKKDARNQVNEEAQIVAEQLKEVENQYKSEVKEIEKQISEIEINLPMQKRHLDILRNQLKEKIGNDEPTEDVETRIEEVQKNIQHIIIKKAALGDKISKIKKKYRKLIDDIGRYGDNVDLNNRGCEVDNFFSKFKEIAERNYRSMSLSSFVRCTNVADQKYDKLREELNENT